MFIWAFEFSKVHASALIHSFLHRLSFFWCKTFIFVFKKPLCICPAKSNLNRKVYFSCLISRLPRFCIPFFKSLVDFSGWVLYSLGGVSLHSCPSHTCFKQPHQSLGILWVDGAADHCQIVFHGGNLLVSCMCLFFCQLNFVVPSFFQLSAQVFSL